MTHEILPVRRTNVKMWYKLTSSNAKGKLLPPKYRNQFASKQIVCVEYADIVDDAEREIFQVSFRSTRRVGVWLIYSSEGATGCGIDTSR